MFKLLLVNKELFNSVFLIIIIIMNYQTTYNGVKKMLFPLYFHLLAFISISSPNSN